MIKHILKNKGGNSLNLVTTSNDSITFTKPKTSDSIAMWELVKQSTLDNNSPYSYLMMCEFFSDTCVITKVNDEVIGFITAFIPPKKQNVIFIWQVGVSSTQRGKQIASKMIYELLSREASKHVRYIEATVTPSNIASQALFNGLARKLNTNVTTKVLFPKELFPQTSHEEEVNFRIGPIHK